MIRNKGMIIPIEEDVFKTYKKILIEKDTSIKKDIARYIQKEVKDYETRNKLQRKTELD